MRAARRTCRSCQAALKSLNGVTYLQRLGRRSYASEPPEPYRPETTAIHELSQVSPSEGAPHHDAGLLLSSTEICTSTVNAKDHKQNLFTFPYPSLNHSNKDGAASSASQSPPPIDSHPQRELEGLDSQLQATHSKLVDILETVDQPDDAAIDHLFDLYNSLPKPRVCYLSRGEVQKLFTLLSRQNNMLKKVGNQ